MAGGDLPERHWGSDMAGQKGAKSESLEQSLRRLADALPLHAEESNDREVLDESALVSTIAECGLSTEIAAGQLALICRVFAALGLLDTNELAGNRWAFVSFPAMLLAKSVLETLSTQGQQFFVQGYWTQGKQRSEEEEDAQRHLISYLEDWRVCSHPRGAANPIRVVHVSWGFIKIDGRFALHRREDKSRPGTKRYVPPGGRVIPEDLPHVDRNKDSLRCFWSPRAKLPPGAYEAGLKRELAEELSLRDSDFQARHIKTVDSFCQVEGSANHRAYTCYRINIYSIKLTSSSELVVLDCIHKEPEAWAWFTPDELFSGKNASGSSAYIDALLELQGLNSLEFLSKEIPDSSPVRPRSRHSSQSIQIPADHSGLIYEGKSGKQRPFSYDLSVDEWSLLATLAWHSLGHRVSVQGEKIDLLGARWIRLNDYQLLAAASRIARKLQPGGIPIVDIEGEGYCRLDYPPENIFLDPLLFVYDWLDEEPRKKLRLILRSVTTSISVLEKNSTIIPLADSFARDIASIEQGREPEGEFARQCRNHFQYPRSLGLRVFASELKGTFDITVARHVGGRS